MGIQLVVNINAVEPIESALGNIASECEVFPMHPGHFGVSIPTKVVDAVGDQVLAQRLTALNYFDLWEGRWK